MCDEPALDGQRLEFRQGALNFRFRVADDRRHHADARSMLHQLPVREMALGDDREVLPGDR